MDLAKSLQSFAEGLAPTPSSDEAHVGIWALDGRAHAVDPAAGARCVADIDGVLVIGTETVIGAEGEAVVEARSRMVLRASQGNIDDDGYLRVSLWEERAGDELRLADHGSSWWAGAVPAWERRTRRATPPAGRVHRVETGRSWPAPSWSVDVLELTTPACLTLTRWEPLPRWVGDATEATLTTSVRGVLVASWSDVPAEIRAHVERARPEFAFPPTRHNADPSLAADEAASAQADRWPRRGRWRDRRRATFRR